MFDNALFYSQAPEKLQGSHALLEARIKEYAQLADAEADLLQAYREKRSALLRESLKSGTPVTIAGDIARGECAKEKAAWAKALAKKQQCRYAIDAVTNRIYTIRHLSSQIEHQTKA